MVQTVTRQAVLLLSRLSLVGHPSYNYNRLILLYFRLEFHLLFYIILSHQYSVKFPLR